KAHRQDVDVIVMAAPPAQARQLKPLFDFYYAEDVPVLATSSIYSGSQNPRSDRDVNGVVFCDMPWLLDTTKGAGLRQLLN
ncbi:MAG TPA: penicillin-binding protein activator, partial [Candidatus Berkiella sp.]|nr:penicillin-binding protein activator [Candidatus Berkiella sp.]